MKTTPIPKITLVILTPLFVLNVFGQEQEMFKSFPPKWEVEIGNTAHRSNVAFTNKHLIIGSNGMHYMDSREDEKAGVYMINRRTGKVDKTLAKTGTGDLDVCGVLVHKNKIYFGNDNGEFFCYNQQGNLIWRNYCSAQVEHAPVIIKRYGKEVLVYTSLSGELRAVNPNNGRTIWKNYPKTFKGWKPDDGVNYMQVSTRDYSSPIYFTQPVVVDLNKDGNDELLFNLYDSEAVAYSGVNGREKFRIKQAYFTRFEVLLAGRANETILTFNHKSVPGKSFKEGKNITHTPYEYPGYVQANNHRGDSTNATMIPDFEWNGEKSLNHFKKNNGNVVIATQADIIEINAKAQIVKSLRRSGTYERKSYYTGDIDTTEFLGGYNSLIGTDVFMYKGNRCLMVMDQDYRTAPKGKYSGKAKITIFKEDLSAIVDVFEFPASSEFPPTIADVDKDGAKDLLVSLRNGKLYCLALENVKTVVQSK